MSEPIDKNMSHIHRQADLEEIGKIVEKIRRKNLTYLSNSKLALIAKTCFELSKNNISGGFIEAGCALGGSAIFISKLKNKNQPLYIYDVFGMIPPPSEEDPPEVHKRYSLISEGGSNGINGDRYYGYLENLLDKVKDNFHEFDVNIDEENIYFIQGLVQDTLFPTAPIALAHIDVDWYEPVLTCLQRITPYLSVGGSIILDDYNDWGGCRKATDYYLSSTKLKFSRDETAKSLKLTLLGR